MEAGSALAGPLIDLVVISGFSGAGKSSAMRVFEDSGYFCVDNLPPEMLSPLAALFSLPGSKVRRAAVVCDTRSGDYFGRLTENLNDLSQTGVSYHLIFLQADDQTLVNRYKQTRRRHPLAPEGMIGEGIANERNLLAPIRDGANLIIDTTGLSQAGLREKLVPVFAQRRVTSKLAVNFVSFGHQYGPPRDADLVFDVRFLNNPFYEAELSALTGFDQQVVEFIAEDPRLDEFYSHLFALLDYLLPQYVVEGKAHLVIAVGCTGGRHRSVVVTERLVERYRCDEVGYIVAVHHRDVGRRGDREMNASLDPDI